MGDQETQVVVRTSGVDWGGSRISDSDTVYCKPLVNVPRTADNELPYPTGFDFGCNTCYFLATNYGPDDPETITHASEGKHTYGCIKIGRITAGAITTKFLTGVKFFPIAF